MKYGNKKIIIDGIEFHSMLEGAFYQKLKAYKEAGKIYDFKMQVPYVLHGANGIAICKYKLDFEIEMPEILVSGGVWQPAKLVRPKRCVEVKGYWTAVAKLKKKLFQAEYGVLEIHTKDRPWELETPRIRP